MTHELKDYGLFNLLRHRADVDAAFLREATQRATEVNANVERILDAPLRELEPASKENKNGLR